MFSRTHFAALLALCLAFESAFCDDFTCEIAGTFADPAACENFIECVDDGQDDLTKHVFTCAPGTLFDENSLICNFSAYVCCGSRPRPAGDGSDPQTCGGTNNSTTTKAPPKRNPRELYRALQPAMETYWESYDSWPYDYNTCYYGEGNPIDDTAYAYDLRQIPVATETSPGVNVVNIAFAAADGAYCQYAFGCQPLVCGLHLFGRYEENNELIEDFRQDISYLQSQGALVKLAFGGEEWGNINLYIDTPGSAGNLVRDIAAAVNDLGLDGVDLTQEEGCGPGSFRCREQTSIHLYVLEKLRKELPDKLISYTYPEKASDFPFYDIVRYGAQFVDYFIAYRATDEDVRYALEEAGLPAQKLVWGVAPGCNPYTGYGSDADGEVTVSEAEAVADAVVQAGMAGVATWSVNRDTDHRPGREGDGCQYRQTGQPDGTYINAIYNRLNQ